MISISGVTLFGFLLSARTLQHVNSAWIKDEERILCILALSHSLFRLELSEKGSAVMFERLQPGVRIAKRPI